MKLDWRTISHIGAAMVGLIVPGVSQVEELAWTIGGMHGNEKQNAVVEMVLQGMTAVKGVTGAQLASDPDVEHATRSVIDAVVALQTILAKKAPAVTGTV